VTVFEAVPRFGCLPPPYPPQPPSVSDSATMVTAAVAVKSEAGRHDTGTVPSGS